MLAKPKLTAIFLLAALLQTFAGAYAQNITLSEKKASLQKVFRDIEKQTDYLFWYEYPLLEHKPKVTVKMTNVPISDALDLCLKGQSLKYTIIGKTIVVTETNTEANTQSINALPLEISGKVTDTTGAALEGVSVSVPGSDIGAITDESGNFRLAVLRNASLHFTLVSYQSVDVQVKKNTSFNICMHVVESSMNDVVVVGYGSLSKKNITGSISSIKTKGMEVQPLSSLDQVIAGQAAGVQVSQLTGTPGGGAVIRVRGTGSISAGNEPLYVIDGFPIEGSYNRDLNPLATINLNDIESIQILKDASAVAIYGSRGSNGVVIVTTKRGTADRPKVEFDGYYGAQQVAHKIDMLNAAEYAAFNTEARNNAWSDKAGNADDPDSIRPAAFRIPPMFRDPSSLGKGTDWQDQVFRTAPVRNYNIRVSNGKEGTRYMLSAGYFDQKGIVANTGFKRYSVRFNFDSKLFEKIKIGFNIAPTYSSNDALPVDNQIFESSILGSALAMPPTVPVHNPDGSYTYLLKTSPYNIGILNNPVAVANKLKEGTSAFRTLAGMFAEWEILEGLRLRSSLGADYYEDRYNFFWPSDLGRGSTAPPVIAQGTASTTRNFVWLSENTISWNTSIHHKHVIDAVAGITSQRSISQNASVDAVYFPSNVVTTLNAGQIDGGGTNISEWSLFSYLARINYSYQSKYLFTGTLRRDGSSRFGPDNKWGAFPSASVGWNISRENFMQTSRVISDLKIRASYGYAGNNTIGNYNYLSLLHADRYVFGSGNGNFVDGFQPGNIGNPDLGWEVMRQSDIGADIGLFRNRVTVIVDYFNKVTSHLLLNVPVPGSIGYATALENIGRVSNKGWEITLASNNLVNAFKWHTTINFSSTRNKVLALGPNGDPIISSSQSFNAQTHITMVGQPLANFYGYQVIGVYRDQADVDKSARVQGPNGSRPGDLKFRDVNGDGVITPLDMTIIGHNNPDFIYGCTNDFSFGSFSLSILIDGVKGAQLLNGGRKNISLATGSYSRRDVLGRWQSPEHPGDGKTPRANVAPTGGNVSFISSLLVEDASFLRFRNISLRYSIPAGILKKSALNNASVYISVQNAAMITRYRGYNPEQSFTGANSLTPGGDFNGYPLARVFSAGIQVTFQ